MNDLVEALQHTVFAIQGIQDLLSDRTKYDKTPENLFYLLELISDKQQAIVNQLQTPTELI